MTYDIKALRELEKRLAEAKGPDREFDRAIYWALFSDAKPSFGGMGRDFFTVSLDAAVALVERVLWGRGLLIGRGRTRPDEPLWGAREPSISLTVHDIGIVIASLCYTKATMSKRGLLKDTCRANLDRLVALMESAESSLVEIERAE